MTCESERDTEADKWPNPLLPLLASRGCSTVSTDTAVCVYVCALFSSPSGEPLRRGTSPHMTFQFTGVWLRRRGKKASYGEQWALPHRVSERRAVNGWETQIRKWLKGSRRSLGNSGVTEGKRTFAAACQLLLSAWKNWAARDSCAIIHSADFLRGDGYPDYSGVWIWFLLVINLWLVKKKAK